MRCRTAIQQRLLALLAAASIGVAACAHSERATDPDNPNGPAGSLVIRPEGDSAATVDTLIVGNKEWLMVVGVDTTAPVSWTVSDTTVVSVLKQYFSRVQLNAVRAGRATVTARYDGDSGTFELVVRELAVSDTAPFVDITTSPTDSAIVGDTVPFGFNLMNRQGDFFFGRPFTLTLSDSTVLRLIRTEYEHGFYFRATKVGRTFVKITSGGSSDSSEIIVHEPRATAPDPRASRYEAIDLGTLGGETAFPLALNDNGQVVGYSMTGDGKQHAFVWENGVMRDLSAAGDMKSAAHVISKSGVVAGTSFIDGTVHVVVWTSGTRTDLGSVGCCDQRIDVVGMTSTDVVARGDDGSAIWHNGVKQYVSGFFARGMNGQPQVIGTSASRPFLWDNGIMRALELWADRGEAIDINSSGVVIGQITNAVSELHGVSWVNGKISQVLGWIHPVAINDAGDITSDGYGTGYFGHGQQSIQIGSLGSRGTTVADMNDQAMIVGFSWTASMKQHAFVWQPGEATPIDLGAGPVAHDRQGSAATALNARGDIIGWTAPCSTPSGRCTQLDQSRARAILWRLK
jgi:probable HAF family extracellular repeat protein